MIIDISRPVPECPVYPGDTPPVISVSPQASRGGFKVSDITMCVHNGTHADAPSHCIANGAGIGQISLEAFYGECVVGEWEGVFPEGCTRLLLKGERPLTLRDAEVIASSGALLLGCENLSAGEGRDDLEIHRILLAGGVVILEGLDLSRAVPGVYTISAFPLNLGDADGSPVRAVLISG